MQLYHNITSPQVPELAAAGGKGRSLVQLKAAGLTVPPGFILTVDFFRPWLDHIAASNTWQQFRAAQEADITAHCNALQNLCLEQTYSAAQRKALQAALEIFPGSSSLFAVRSSSPEEDTEHASFAGEYKSLLGVQAGGLEQAIKEVFASAFGKTVFLYKKAHGYSLGIPAMAVIVQELVKAAAAGVVFSLNPLNNCYDEAVINANFGLGETVVAGEVSPDTFVVDKVKKQIMEKKPGKKETSLRAKEGGGVYRESTAGAEQFCLDDTWVLKLAALAEQVETLYGKPVDLEWALADGVLYLLQARPITTYFPLPEVLRTKPGAPRRLYMDSTLTKQGIEHPLSVLGVFSYNILMQLMLGGNSFDDQGKSPDKEIGVFIHGRTYTNISNRLRISSKQKFVDEYRIIDPLTAATIAAIDEKEYRAARMPRRLFQLPIATILMIFILIRNIGSVFKDPRKYKEFVFVKIGQFLKDINEPAFDKLSLPDYIKATGKLLIDFLFKITVPFTYATMMAKPRLVKLFSQAPAEIQVMARNVDRSMPENITIEMGLALFKLSQFPAIRDTATEADFLDRLKARNLPQDFLAAWDNFMEHYGHRGPGEIDIAAPRYRDEPQMIYRQVKAMAANRDSAGNPDSVYRKSQEERNIVYGQLKQAALQAGKKTLQKFEKYYAVLHQFGGWRELHKFYMVLLNYKIRERVLVMGSLWTKAGRLDNPGQAFDLTAEEFSRACTDPALDLRALAAANTAYRKLYSHIRQYPRVIDSRGKILTPPVKKGVPGQFSGEPVSPGKVTGLIKILHTPDEKPLLPGEILVARATDPGWTPLFINAAGIILEIGGTLQHGACVAREYGKPCVSAIDNATEIFKDGQQVVLDGTNGIITLAGG